MIVGFSLAEAVRWTGGTVSMDAPDTQFGGASINTRTLARGDLFVAIRGEVHDAHRFIPQALEAGAAGLLVDAAWSAEHAAPEGVPVISVPDTTVALGALAAGHRALFRGPVVAFTGSNGKTTTKEMCHAILSVDAPCLKNEGNLNNEFGLPLTLLARRTEHEAAVVELGMNHRGEIAKLAAIAKPDVGAITNVGTAHIEYLGSQDEIALEKGDLVAALSVDATAVLNADDPRVAAQAERVRGRVLRFGSSPDADVRAEDVRFERGGAFAFTLVTPSGSVPVRIRGLAETTVINALAASAAALAAGASLQTIAKGLAAHDHVPGRMACHVMPAGTQVIDDTYNANPQSMRNALESLARLKGSGRGIAALGDMGELGDVSDAAHEEAGRLAAELGTDFLFTLGEQGERVARAAIAAGMQASHVHVGTEHEAVGRAIAELVEPSDWVLVKGSRSMKMERVVESLIAKETT